MAMTVRYTPPKLDARLVLAAAVPEATNEIAQAVLDASQPLVPEELGTLKKSGRVEQDGRPAYVTYGRDDDGDQTGGSPTNAYAAVQHEHLEFHHPNGGSAKYLELAVHDQSTKAAARARAAAVLRGALGL